MVQRRLRDALNERLLRGDLIGAVNVAQGRLLPRDLFGSTAGRGEEAAARRGLERSGPVTGNGSRYVLPLSRDLSPAKG